MKFKTNQTAQTPIGPGVVQSAVIIVPGQPRKYLVRLPINELTRQHLKDTNCSTPMAAQSGLWVFTEDELGEKAVRQEETHAAAN